VATCTKLKGVRPNRWSRHHHIPKPISLAFISVHDLPAIPPISTTAIVICATSRPWTSETRQFGYRPLFLRGTRLDPVHPLAAIGPFHHVNPNVVRQGQTYKHFPPTKHHSLQPQAKRIKRAPDRVKEDREYLVLACRLIPPESGLITPAKNNALVEVLS
jgi:hypothetical protein